jgi:predicted RND superfamily exporter protein
MMREKVYQGVARFITRFSGWIIMTTLAAVLLSSVFIFRLNFENDMTYWVDKNSKLGRLPHYINEKFGSNTPLLVAIDFGDVFTFRHLNQLNTFSDELFKLQGVDDVVSLANVEDIVSTEEGIKVKKLIDYPLSDDEQSLARLKEYILSKNVYAGRIVSDNGRVALVMVKPKFELKADTVAWEVKKLAQNIFDQKEEKLYYSGSPFLLNSMARIVISDFIFLIPLVTILVIAVLFFSFRSWRGIILPLLTVLFSGVLTMGIMSVLGVPLNVMSSAVPVLLIAVGSAYGIHVLNNYYQNSRKISDKKELTVRMMKEVGLPVLMAGLTTVAGFISNVVADISPIKTYGIFTAVGVMLALAIALLFIPAVLFRMPISKNPLLLENKKKETAPRAKFKLALIVARICFKYKYTVIIATVLLGVGFFVFSFKITSKVDILGYFSKDSEPQEASRFVNENFGGFNPLDIYLKGDMENPDILKLSLMLEERIKSHKNLSRPYGAADMVCELSQAMDGLNTIPETRLEVENLWFLMSGKNAMSSLATEDKREGLVSVLLPSLDNEYLNELFDDLNAFIKDYGKNIKIMENAAGNPYLRVLEELMLKNLLSEKKIVFTDSQIQNVLFGLAADFKNYQPVIDEKSLVAYLSGDEAEIPLSEGQSRALAAALWAEKNPDTEKIRKAVLHVLAPELRNQEEEIGALTRSIETIITDYNTKNRLEVLKGQLIAFFPELAKSNPEALNYVLAPFFWQTIPVPNQAGGAVVRTTPIEAMELTGSAYLLEGIRRSIFNNQVSSLVFALLAVFILNFINFRLLRVALISMVSIIFTIMVNFGIMGIFGIPLDFATAIIAGVAIGTGIDYTIHFISRFKEELKNHKGDKEKAYAVTLATTGKAIIFNALSVGLGYSVLLASNVIPLRTAGLLLAVTMFTSSTSAMTFLPAVLLASRVRLIREKAPGLSWGIRWGNWLFRFLRPHPQSSVAGYSNKEIKK